MTYRPHDTSVEVPDRFRIRNPHGWVSPEVNWGGYETLDENTPLQGRTVLKLASIGQAEPEVLTISLNRVVTSEPLNLDWRAHVQWGGGKLTHSAMVDWAHGTMVKVVGTAVQVDALPFPPRLTSMSTEGQRQSLGAIVGFGAFGGIAPTYTQTLAELLAGASSAPVRPPPFAKGLSVYSTSLAAAGDPYPALRLDWLHIGGAQLGSVAGVYLAGGAAMPMPGYSLIQVTNTHATDAVTPTLVWHLDLSA